MDDPQIRRIALASAVALIVAILVITGSVAWAVVTGRATAWLMTAVAPLLRLCGCCSCGSGDASAPRHQCRRSSATTGQRS